MSDSNKQPFAFIPQTFGPIVVSCRDDWRATSISRLLTAEESATLWRELGLSWKSVELDADSLTEVLSESTATANRRLRGFSMNTVLVQKGEVVVAVTQIRGRDGCLVRIVADLPIEAIRLGLQACTTMTFSMEVARMLGYMAGKQDPNIVALRTSLLDAIKETRERLIEATQPVEPPTTPTSTDVKPEETVQKVESAATDVKPGTDGAKVTEAQPVKKLAPTPPHQKPRLAPVSKPKAHNKQQPKEKPAKPVDDTPHTMEHQFMKLAIVKGGDAEPSTTQVETAAAATIES